MTSDNTINGDELREGQDHEPEDTLGDIRLQRFVRLLFGLGVPVVSVIGAYRIADAGGDPLEVFFEVMVTIVAIASCALICVLAGVRAAQLQTVYDETTTPSTNQ